MLVIGLAGQAGVGKNEIAEYLVKRYGFVQFAFSDALYWEVQQAFGLEDQEMLRNRETKEVPSARLALEHCAGLDFVRLVDTMQRTQNPLEWQHNVAGQPHSPREILQWWGTEYRRAQDENYWVKQAAAFVEQMHFLPPYPELRPMLFVETGTRFENERGWIKSIGGNLWHVHRGEDKVLHEHASAIPLPVLPDEREIWNNSTIEQLHGGVDLLLSTGAKFVRVEPMLLADTYASDCSVYNEPAYPNDPCAGGAD